MLDAVINFVGMVALWLLAILLLAVFPFAEFARGMASGTPPPRSKFAIICSIVGACLIALLIFGQ